MNSIRRNFIYNSLYEILIILIPLITTPYLTRTLGAVGVGEYSYRYSVARYFGLFILLGVNKYGNRSIAKCRNDSIELSKTFWSIYSFQMIMGTIVTSIYVIYSAIINDIISFIMGLYVFSCVFDINWFYFGLEKFSFTVSCNSIIKICSTIVIFLGVKSKTDVWIYCLILTSASLITQVVLWPKAVKIVGYYKPKLNEIYIHIKPNLILFIPVVAISLYKTMDKIMLGMMTSLNQVGFYEASEKIVGIPIAFVEALGTVMLPRVSNIVAKNSDNEVELLYKSLLLSLFLSTSLGFGIMGLAKDFIPFFYGTGYEACLPLYYILLPASIFISVANVIRTQYLIPHSYDSIFVISTIIGAVVNIILNIILIPNFKSIGAALGTLFAEASVCIYQIIKIHSYIPIFDYLKRGSVLVLCGGIMFAVLTGIHMEYMNNVIIILMVKTLLGAFFYFVSFILIELIVFSFTKKTVFGLNIK